jgi:hypothetical protein
MFIVFSISNLITMFLTRETPVKDLSPSDFDYKKDYTP